MKNMQKMNTKQGVLLGISVGAAGLIAAACSSDEPSTPAPMPTGTVTGTTTSVTPPPGPTGSTPVITPTGPTGSNTAPVTTGPTGGTGTTAPTVPMSTCTNIAYDRDNELLAASGFPGVHVVYGYGDMMTSLCSGAATAPAMLCVEGNAVSSKGPDNDYQYYGAGVGLQMTAAVGGVAEAPWDAAALGIVGVKFSVSNVVGRVVRVQVAQVDEPDLPYQANNFLRGGTMYAPNEIKIGDMEEVSIPLTDFKLPEWSAGNLMLEEDAVLDPTKIYALSFQIANALSDDTELYSFCISNLEWIDAAGAPVAVPVVTDPVPSSSGGDSSAPPVGSGDSSAPDTSGADSSGADTSGEDTGTLVNFQSDVLPIFAANCGDSACHNGANPPAGLNLTMEPNATQAAAIVSRINNTDPAQRMPRNADALPAEEIATIEAWADTKN